MWFITRRRYDAEVSALKRRVLATEARHDEAEEKRRRLARMLAEATSENRRLKSRTDELDAAVATLTEANRRAERDAARLQARLDDALGLTSPAVEAGADWQKRRQDAIHGGAV